MLVCCWCTGGGSWPTTVTSLCCCFAYLVLLATAAASVHILMASGDKGKRVGVTASELVSQSASIFQFQFSIFVATAKSASIFASIFVINIIILLVIYFMLICVYMYVYFCAYLYVKKSHRSLARTGTGEEKSPLGLVRGQGGECITGSMWGRG